MVTQTTTSIRAAHTIEEMQQVARNQIRDKIAEFEERIENLKRLSDQVESITGWESYENIAYDVIFFGDAPEAVIELANEYGTMQAGDYF